MNPGAIPNPDADGTNWFFNLPSVKHRRMVTRFNLSVRKPQKVSIEEPDKP